VNADGAARQDPSGQAYWDHRYARRELLWSAEPNATAASVLADLPPGRALDVATGEGRMALWLARRGWAVRALDISDAGLAKARISAAAAGLDIAFEQADVTHHGLGNRRYDLVLVLYLHLPGQQLKGVLSAAADAVAAGGTLLVLGHDQDNLSRGVGGPQDPDVLYDTAVLGAATTGLQVQRLERVERVVASRTAVDTLLVARR
jgi:2-polyprenyl-3-methyl-5-hydroxy-6-metoxy-1,4-benzoquinol methylase